MRQAPADVDTRRADVSLTPFAPGRALQDDALHADIAGASAYCANPAFRWLWHKPCLRFSYARRCAMASGTRMREPEQR